MNWPVPPTLRCPTLANLVEVDLVDQVARLDGLFGVRLQSGPWLLVDVQPRGIDCGGEPRPVEHWALPIADARTLHRDLGVILRDLDAEAHPPAPAHRSTHP